MRTSAGAARASDVTNLFGAAPRAPFNHVQWEPNHSPKQEFSMRRTQLTTTAERVFTRKTAIRRSSASRKPAEKRCEDRVRKQLHMPFDCARASDVLSALVGQRDCHCPIPPRSSSGIPSHGGDFRHISSRLQSGSVRGGSPRAPHANVGFVRAATVCEIVRTHHPGG